MAGIKLREEIRWKYGKIMNNVEIYGNMKQFGVFSAFYAQLVSPLTADPYMFFITGCVD